MLTTTTTTTTTTNSTAIAIAASTDTVLELWLSTKSLLTQKAYRRDIYQFLTFTAIEANLATVELPKFTITLNHLVAFKTALEKLGRAASTVSRKLASIKSLLSFMKRAGLTAFNPGTLLPLKRQQRPVTERILSKSKVSEMTYKTENFRDQTILKTLYVLGLRVSELVSLTWDNIAIKADGNAIATIIGKGDKTRAVIIPSDLLQDLLSLKREGSNIIFHSRKNCALQRIQIYRIVKAAGSAIGNDSVSPHWLRHCNISHSLDAGCPVPVVQSSVGHASLATTMLYVHANPQNCTSLYLSV